MGGGGRYDDLTNIFGLKGLSGIGFSFGIDRLYDIMEEQGLLENTLQSSIQVMITNLTNDSQPLGLQLLSHLREASLKAIVYPTPVKLKKQLHYANKKRIPFVVIMDNEREATQPYALKNMQTGEQINCNLTTLIKTIS